MSTYEENFTASQDEETHIQSSPYNARERFQKGARSTLKQKSAPPATASSPTGQLQHFTHQDNMKVTYQPQAGSRLLEQAQFSHVAAANTSQAEPFLDMLSKDVLPTARQTQVASLSSGHRPPASPPSFGQG